MYPLRKDLVALNQAQRKSEDEQLGGQLDGAMMSRATANASESSDSSSDSDTDLDVSGDEAGHDVAVIDLTGNVPSQSSSDASSSESENDVEEGGVKECLKLRKNSREAFIPSNTRLSTLSTHGSESLDPLPLDPFQSSCSKAVERKINK